MHELSITQSMVALAERHAREGGATKVLSVTIEIGALSGLLPDAVAFCFEACTRDTLLDGAKLIIEEIEGAGRCASCDWEGPIASRVYACPGCGGFAMRRVRGEELRLKELEVE